MDLEAGESAAFHRSERELSGLGLCVVAGIGVKTSYLSNHDAAHLYQRPRLQIEEGRRARPQYGVLLRARLVPMWLAAFLLGRVGSLACPFGTNPRRQRLKYEQTNRILILRLERLPSTRSTRHGKFFGSNLPNKTRSKLQRLECNLAIRL